MLEFESPSWLYAAGLIPLVAVWAWRSKATLSRRARRLCVLLRTCGCILVVGALAGPVCLRQQKQTLQPEVIVLRDVSKSVSGDSPHIQTAAAEFAAALPPAISVKEIAFATNVPTASPPTEEDTNGTDIEAALDYASANRGKGASLDVILLSDGRATVGDPLAAAGRLRAAQGRVHVVPVGKPLPLGPPRITEIVPPENARVGASATAKVSVWSERPTDLRLTLLDDDGIEATHADAHVGGGRTLALTWVPKRKGSHRWRATLSASGKLQAVSDSVDLWFLVSGPPRVLLADPDPLASEPLKRILGQLGYECQFIALAGFAQSAEAIKSFDVVLLNDWPAPTLSNAQLQQLKSYVAAGGAVMFVGGVHVSTKQWHGSELERMLPVDFAPEAAVVLQEPQPVHVCFVLDVSGSMTEPLGVDASGRVVTKFEMLKQAVFDSVRELPASAFVSLIVFDIQHRLLLNRVAVSQHQKITTVVRGIGVGGGTNMVPALEEAASVLERDTVAKHIIFLTDGLSIERPGEDLCERLRNADIGLAVVAVGADSDTVNLERFAEGARGQYAYCGDAAAIPRVFIQEARTIKTLATMPREPFEPRLGDHSELMRGLADGRWPMLEAAIPAVPKSSPLVEILLLTDKGQPLLAVWPNGLGRVAAFMSDAKPIWARRWFQWLEYQRFWGRLLTALLHAAPEYRTRVEWRRDPNQLVILVSVRDLDGHLISDVMPRGAVQIDAKPELSAQTAVEWRQLPTGLFQGTVPLPTGHRAVCDLDFGRRDGSRVLYRHIVVAGQMDAEASAAGPDESAIRTIADAGGGIYNPSPVELAQTLGTASICAQVVPLPLWPAFVLLAVLLWPIDVACRRFIG
jgi:uncharacterized membrane protein